VPCIKIDEPESFDFTAEMLNPFGPTFDQGLESFFEILCKG
jgi:hypothetical protein